MTIFNTHLYLVEKLQSVYDASEAANIAEWVLESLTSYNRLDQRLHAQQLLTASQHDKLNVYLQELLRHRPVQYVLGECYFMDLKLFVDESVLVPRPETEELVDWIIKFCQSQGLSAPVMLDIGTGSGCIALALKKHIPAAQVIALDISSEALNIARKNATATKLEIQWQQLDILDPETWNLLPKFDIIVSNPPYITLPEKESMMPNVLSYEPHQALFVTDEDPQQFYKAIEALAENKLLETGYVFLELHRDFAGGTQRYYASKDWQTILRKDMQENDRMMMAHRKS